MKFGKILGTLLVLNLAMVVYLVIVVTRGPMTPMGSPFSSDTSMASSRNATNRTPSQTSTNAPVVYVTNQFHWSQLESQDYHSYVQKLRAIGCPEQTIRDIIIADLDLLWAGRIWSIYPRRQVLRYWDTEDEDLRNNFDQRQFQSQEKTVDREKREIIRELLGADLAGERLKLEGQEDAIERRLAFLDDDKRMDVRATVERFQDEEWKIREKLWEEGVDLNDEERAKLKELRRQRDEELNRLLTPEERRQYDLWMSDAASVVRHNLYGMQASEQEFLEVYQLQKKFEENWRTDEVDFGDPEEAAGWEKARAELELQVKESLGEDRYAEYVRGQDEDFHLLNAAVSRYDLDREKAAAVYDYKRALQSEQERVMTDPNMSPAQKESALAAMEQETQMAVKDVLGENAYNYYRRRTSWLR